jgi:hypothetical protein
MAMGYGNQGANYYGSAAGLEGRRLAAQGGLYSSLLNLGGQVAQGLGKYYGGQGGGDDDED